MKNILLSFFLVGLSWFFFQFSYNSGYGHDALEYIVISRSLLEGFPLYYFIPSKSWGFYQLIAFYFSIGKFINLWGVALLVTMAYMACVIGAFFVTRKVLGFGAALLSIFLIGTCGFFMEMNFLEPEGFVFLSGLAAFSLALGGSDKRRVSGPFLGGVSLGMGAAFKVVAIFYALGIFAFFCLGHKSSVKDIFLKSLLLFAGLVLSLALPALYFFSTGRLSEHLEWQYIFHILHYPTHFAWAYKVYTKLSWFWIYLAPTIIALFIPKIRKKIIDKPPALLALLMGIFALVPTLKTQASHYFFPAAGFLSIYMAAFFEQTFGLQRKKIILFTSLLLVFSAISTYSYKPAVFVQLFKSNTIGEDKNLEQFIQQHVPPGKTALFFKDAAYLYWISHRYPHFPFIYFHRQTTLYLENAPDTLLKVVEDPNLTLIEFDENSTLEEDYDFFSDPKNRPLLEVLRKKIAQQYHKVDFKGGGYTFWVRNKFNAS